MTTVLRIATLLFLIICPKLGQADDIPLCCLCQGCSFAIAGRGDVFVDSMGKTCNDLILEMADDENSSTHGSSECRRLQNLHHDRCCNPNHTPTPIPQNARSGALTGGSTATSTRWVRGGPPVTCVVMGNRRGISIRPWRYSIQPRDSKYPMSAHAGICTVMDNVGISKIVCAHPRETF